MTKKAGKRQSLVSEACARLRLIRIARGMTTVELGRRMKLSQAQVSRIENCLQGLRSAVLERACNQLDISPVVLFIEQPLAKQLLKTRVGRKIRGLDLIV